MTRQSWLPGSVMAVMTTMAIGCGAPEPDGNPAASVAQAVTVGPLAARPDTVDFGKVAVGVAARQSVTLVNTGTATVDITAVTSTATFPPDPCRPILIQPCIRPGESTTLAIECAPTAIGLFGGHVDLAYKSGLDTFSLSVPYSGTGYFNVDLDPARLFVRFLGANGYDSGDIQITSNNNTISHPLLLHCDVTQYGSQVDVRYLTGGDPVYPQLQSRYYILPNTTIWSGGYSNTQHFSVDASNLNQLLPLTTETAGQASISAIDQFRDYLFQPGDLPANTTVRHAMHVTLFTNAGYSAEVTDGVPLDNNRSVYIRRVCP